PELEAIVEWLPHRAEARQQARGRKSHPENPAEAESDDQQKQQQCECLIRDRVVCVDPHRARDDYSAEHDQSRASESPPHTIPKRGNDTVEAIEDVVERIHGRNEECRMQNVEVILCLNEECRIRTSLRILPCAFPLGQVLAGFSAKSEFMSYINSQSEI